MNQQIAGRLLKWYHTHRRELPWRGVRDPYRVWVSEIILQQTRVDQGLGYYFRFLERFPDLPSLASAAPDEVLKAWQGLGYYSRARNMHHAARQVTAAFNGRFPSTSREIRMLKGIGDYTAAAIASICFDEAVPVVDGNVIRFLGRLSGISEPLDTTAGKKKIFALASELITGTPPGDFNQAMMEFGALYCKPVNPGCGSCIFRKMCKAHLTGQVALIPVKSRPKKPADRYFHYLVATLKTPEGELLFLRRREGNDIWKGLYEFPMIETARPLTADRLVKSDEWNGLFRGSGARLLKAGGTVKHQLSHQLIHARFYEVTLRKPLPGEFRMIPRERLEEFPFPRLISRYLGPDRG